MSFSGLTLLLSIGLLSVAIYIGYKALLPSPIPGIPYTTESANRLFGDIPEILKWQSETDEVWSFFTKKYRDLQSPVFQAFVRPFGMPWVIVADGRESADILTRRATEFDRSKYFTDLFSATLPRFQATMRTTDTWRTHRRLVTDTMSPGFLQTTNASAIYAAFTDLLELWELKAKLAGNRPVDLESDIRHAAIDAIWSAAFGKPAGSMKSQSQFLASAVLELPRDSGEVVRFPVAPIPVEVQALIDVAESSEIVGKSPLGYYHHKFATIFYPELRAAMKQKNLVIKQAVRDAQRRLKHVSDNHGNDIKSATDLIIAREHKAAQKEGREPDLFSAAIRDEIGGYIVAGHDTSASSISWGLGYMIHHQPVQKKLRNALRAAFPEAEKSKSNPSASDIVGTSIPYLDAFIEEFMRLGAPATAHIRVANCDTQVLGHFIPKGTGVFMLVDGPGLTSPALPIDETKRSQTCIEAKGKTREFGASDIHLFRPERWLKRDESGTEVFDSSAGLAFPFGGGVRGCFGKRLALLELRIIFALVVWNFECLPVSEPPEPLRGRQVLTRKTRDVVMRLRSLKD